MRHDGRDRRAPPEPWQAPPRDELGRLWRITLCATALLILIVITIACGNGGGEALPTPIENGTPPGDPSACGAGLAAVDLAGNCRAQPNPTHGALEAVN